MFSGPYMLSGKLYPLTFLSILFYCFEIQETVEKMKSSTKEA